MTTLPSHRPLHRGIRTAWRSFLTTHYSSLDTSNPEHDLHWCPIAKYFCDSYTREPHQFIPHSLPATTITSLFNADGEKLLWSLENGMLCENTLSKRLRYFEFCIIPLVGEGGEEEFKFVLMREETRSCTRFQGQTYGDLDGTILEWREGNETRPSKRVLFFNYLMCVVKVLREKKKGWEKLIERVERGELWVEKGEYLREEVVRAFLGNLDVPKGLLMGTTFVGGEEDVEERKEGWVKDLNACFDKVDEEEEEEDEY